MNNTTRNAHHLTHAGTVLSTKNAEHLPAHMVLSSEIDK